MYFRLVEAFPEYVVLAEVAFSALLYARGQGTRNAFNRLRADFVVCDKSFRVVAVIEVDDSTHDNKVGREKDAARDVMLEGAGYRVLRYRSVPDVERLRHDIITPSRLR